MRQGLDHASGYFRQAIARRLRMKVAPAVKFEVDQVFEQAERVEKLLREDAAAHPSAPRRRAEATSRRRAMTTAATNSAGAAAGCRRRGAGVDKPIGPTSFDVVRQVRRAARRARASATAARWTRRPPGVLPICLGEATKLAQFLLDADKEYDVHGLLRRRDRHRRRGRDRHRRAATRARVDEAAVRARAGARSAARSRRCRPIYSALKRDGRPLYDYARAGEAVEVAPRAVVVHELELTSFAGPARSRFTMRCSKGTYVRALARDLGRALGVGAHVTALRRTRSGPFSLAEARPLDEVLAALADRRGPGGAAAGRARRRARATSSSASSSDEVARDVAPGPQASLLERWRTGAWRSASLCLLDGRGKLVAVARAARRTGRSSCCAFSMP